MQIDKGDVYYLCNKYDWFTGGTNEQYEKMFSRVPECHTYSDLAELIWLCTPDSTIEDITHKLKEYSKKLVTLSIHSK